MGKVDKGVIVSIEGPQDQKGNDTLARVHPSSREEIVTHVLTIPWYFRGRTGNLNVGDDVAYVLFEDNTGVIISRMDGNWTGIISGNVTLVPGGEENGDFECQNIHALENIEADQNIKAQKDIEAKEEVISKVKLSTHKHPSNGSSPTPGT